MSKPDESSIMIRPANLTDLDALVAIDIASFPPGIAYSRADIAGLLGSNSTMTSVADISTNNEGFPIVVGFSILGWSGRRGCRSGELITIDVLPQFRRKGIGLALYLNIEGRFRSEGGKNVELHVAVDNRPALHFYERLGYRAIARVPRYYLDRIDAWEMEKALDEAAGRGGNGKLSFR